MSQINKFGKGKTVSVTNKKQQHKDVVITKDIQYYRTHAKQKTSEIDNSSAEEKS